MTLHDHFLENVQMSQMWDVEKNADLKPAELSPGSRRFAWWRCNRGHSWKAQVYSVKSGCACPYCSGRNPIPGETDLATTHPQVLKLWSERNTLKPTEVTAGSHRKVWWKCDNFFRRFGALVLSLALILAVCVPAEASENKTAFQKIFATDDGAEFTYELFLTDQNGMSVYNPRTLSSGDTLHVEIRLSRNNYTDNSYGIEFRLLTRGLAYNNDGTTLRNGTQVSKATYSDGDIVGFAWYDLAQQGEDFANPVLAATWSYTVSDPSMVNITVPVALIYITEDTQEHVPVGTARLFLDINGGRFLGEDVSGEYISGTAVTLPDAEFGEYIFEGWSDGVHLYPAGSKYIVSGIVTLTAQWADLVRDRYVSFLVNGGEFVDADPTGSYADGEVIIMPEATREGYRLTGWSDGVNTYAPGEEYIVTNTVNLTAQWEPVETDEGRTGTEGGRGCCWWCWLLGLFLLIILLWKRRWVKYSLVSGDVKLRYKNGEQEVRIAVVLIDDEDKQHPLVKSGTIRAKRK